MEGFQQVAWRNIRLDQIRLLIWNGENGLQNSAYCNSSCSIPIVKVTHYHSDNSADGTWAWCSCAAFFFLTKNKFHCSEIFLPALTNWWMFLSNTHTADISKLMENAGTIGFPKGTQFYQCISLITTVYQLAYDNSLLFYRSWPLAQCCLTDNARKVLAQTDA